MKMNLLLGIVVLYWMLYYKLRYDELNTKLFSSKKIPVFLKDFLIPTVL